ncbi:hypothetical protein [Oceanobacillus jeddahense]|uniref:Branched-chain amino acid ABC transporter substrate-binding protein n=1 Tax=Oceanobacillus jeddahense TaxID=1462527 RepID=A0ABY5JN29_9BACI|nr:hypothetical protein [Oceanobacillus jeddahense]UUI01710.1 hypothetical protein NP439_16870 [Oceanobacillus jeddahense]
MQKIKDERLKLKNLKNIRVLFMVQTIGILGILGYDLVTKGIDGMTDNPLWFVFIITAIVSAYLSMNISVDHETSGKSPEKGLIISLTVTALISIVIGYLISLSEGTPATTGILIGGIVFICGAIPCFYVYRLRKRTMDN